MKKQIILSIYLSFFCLTAYAQKLSPNIEEKIMSSTLQSHTALNPAFQSLIPDPEKHFNLVMSKEGHHNKQPITLYRFEPNNSMHLNQENVSFLIRNDSNILQGFVRLRPEYTSSHPQVSKEVASHITQEFLKKYAPDLLVNSKNEWIDTHDEIIMIEGKKMTLTGMKVKCRDVNTGLYFWTIIAPDQSVMVFERDVEWDFIRAGRQTQKWLHDSWLSKQI